MIDLSGLAQSIAAHLGEDWAVPAADLTHVGRDLLRADGPHLRVRFTDRRRPARVVVQGVFPGSVRSWDDECPPSITAATDRGADAIAGDIRRRLLPGYLPALARVRRFQYEQATAASARRALADRVQLLLPRARVTSSPPDSHIRADTVEWNPRGGPRLMLRMLDTPDTVGVQLDELPAETAVRICELLAAADGPAASPPKKALADLFGGFPAHWDVALYRSDDGTPVVDVDTIDPDDGNHGVGGVPCLRVYVNDARVYESSPPAVAEAPIEPRPLDVDDVRTRLSQRVLVVTKGGDRSHGVLAEVTEDELVLDPAEDGAATVPFDEAAKVVPLGPRADAGIWTLTTIGLRPAYPSL